MPTPQKTGWTRFDMCLWELCTDYERTERTCDRREETDAEWQHWIDQRVGRAERNRLVKHTVDSDRNQKLREFALTISGTLGPGSPDRFADLAPYGAESNDCDWQFNVYGEAYPHDDDGPSGGDFPPAKARTQFQHWISQRIARANRNRDDRKKPTASRASDDALDHHEMDYDIWIDSYIQQDGEDPLVRGYLASDQSGDGRMGKWGRHEEWYGPSPEFIPVTGKATGDHHGKVLEMVVSQLTHEDACPICKLGVFTRPCITECFHIFCEACLEHWLEESSNCPNCRADIELEECELLDDQIPRPKQPEDDSSTGKAYPN